MTECFFVLSDKAVCISDWSGRIDRVTIFPDMPNWFRDNRDWDKIIEGLKKYGFSSMEIDKIKGENWLQFFRKSFTTE